MEGKTVGPAALVVKGIIKVNVIREILIRNLNPIIYKERRKFESEKQEKLDVRKKENESKIMKKDNQNINL